MKHLIDARDKPGLLAAMMRALAVNAHISFEGDLSNCGLSRVRGASKDETETLKRNTTFPRQDFIVLPLEEDTVRPILDAVLPDARVVDDIIHVQIEKNGHLEFGAYDSFHPECIVAGNAIPRSLLDELSAREIVRSFVAAPESSDGA